jgi:hypothetical protein
VVSEKPLRFCRAANGQPGCRYYEGESRVGRENYYLVDVCHHPKAQTDIARFLVDGVSRYLTCEMMRSEPTCGTDGKLWEPKP